MTTKKCPSCSEEVGRSCRTCPKCGKSCTKGPYVPKKVKGFRAAARARKAVKHKVVKRIAAMVPRWALTQDGAFINLTDNLEIGKTEARELVTFVRMLDAGEQ